MKKQIGFTLLELLIVLLIGAVLTSIAVPSFQSFVKNNRLTTQSNTLSSIVAFARSEAIKRPATTITVCASDGGTSCSTSAKWENGFLVIADVNGDRVIDAGDEIIRVHEPLTGGNSLRAIGFESPQYLQFSGSGILDASGSFVLCDDRGQNYAQALVVTISGQTRFAADENSDGIVNSHAGSAASANVKCPS